MTTDTKAVTRWHNNRAMGNMFECMDGDYVTFTDHEGEVARLRAQIEALVKDAGRYRWLRQIDNAFDYRALARGWHNAHTPIQLDETIDAAMKEQSE